MTRRVWAILLLFGLALSAMGAPLVVAGNIEPVSIPLPPGARPGDIVTYVRPGVIHISRVTNEPLHINVLLFDMTNPAFDLKVGVRNGWLFGRTRTSQIAAEFKALAAVNGDLFASDGIPQGLTLVNGEVMTAPKHRATFAWTNAGEPFIGYFTDQWTWQSEVRTEKGTHTLVTLLNTRCPDDQICTFTAAAHTAPARSKDVKVILDAGGKVLRIVRGESVSISTGVRVLEGVGAGARWLDANATVGSRLTVTTHTDPALSGFRQGISGGPIILRDGAFVQDCLCALRDCSQTKTPKAQLVCEDFSTDWKLRHYQWVRMPRTGIGFDAAKKTLIVAVVDGYQAGYSRGIRQDDFAELLRSFGASTAMELDGGGSSTMWLEGKIANRPPDAEGERYVANALLFYWNDPTLTPTPTPTATRP
jgi:hypothetical protein